MCTCSVSFSIYLQQYIHLMRLRFVFGSNRIGENIEWGFRWSKFKLNKSKLNNMYSDWTFFRAALCLLERQLAAFVTTIAHSSAQRTVPDKQSSWRKKTIKLLARFVKVFEGNGAQFRSHCDFLYSRSRWGKSAFTALWFELGSVNPAHRSSFTSKFRGIALKALLHQ